ncbi:Calcium-dependent protein kinase [Trifolium repens]|nr:Calcium-dependent protein kinase [Trifolium repens]
MTNFPFEISLALEHLRAPLNAQPITPSERYIHEIRVKYRSYYVEYNIHDGTVRLPKLFPDDFGDEIGRLATLVDLKGNQFDVLVDKVNDNIYLTRG